LIFSKLQGGYWPNVELVASKAAQIVQADSNGEDVSAYLASSGSIKKRDASPSKKISKKSTSPTKDVTPAKSSVIQPLRQEEASVKPFKVDESQKFLEPLAETKVVQEEKPEPVQEQPAEVI
jgi:hypothetical protein